MIKHLTIEPTDKYDRREQQGKKFYVYLSGGGGGEDGDNNVDIGYFTDNIWTEIYTHMPDTITLDTMNFVEGVEIFACYINSLVGEGYELISHDHEDEETGERYVFGMSVRFKISKDNKAKLLKELIRRGTLKNIEEKKRRRRDNNRKRGVE
jgi:hypothetical protein